MENPTTLTLEELEHEAHDVANTLAEFYNQLVKNNVPQDVAYNLTRDYMFLIIPVENTDENM